LLLSVTNLVNRVIEARHHRAAHHAITHDVARHAVSQPIGTQLVLLVLLALLVMFVIALYGHARLQFSLGRFRVSVYMPRRRRRR